MEKPTLSVLIKAYNEESKIAKCIESILKEVDLSTTEIVLVDSCSTDDTLSIAKNYPIKIYKLSPDEIPSAPLAAELCYQISSGEFLLFIDGDMELASGFIEAALVSLKLNPKIAGVGGILIDTQFVTEADKKRHRLYNDAKKPIIVKSLGGGGLYKRSAIEDVSYFAHSGLKACEEMELGSRLEAIGYQLLRLSVASFIHTGHSETNMQMCKRLWLSGRFSSYTLLIKSAIGKKWFLNVATQCWFLFIVPASVICSLLFSSYVLSGVSFITTLISIWFAFYILMSLKHRSFLSGFWSVILWWLLSLSSFLVVFRSVRKPNFNIKFIRVQ